MVNFLSTMFSTQNTDAVSVPKSIDKACRRSPSWPPVTNEKRAAVPINEDQIRGIFNRFDANKDGLLSRQELKDAFASMGSRFPALRVALALHHADANGDGYISEAEFDKLVKYTLKRAYKFK